jgi:hypothetical protein
MDRDTLVAGMDPDCKDLDTVAVACMDRMAADTVVVAGSDHRHH